MFKKMLVEVLTGLTVFAGAVNTTVPEKAAIIEEVSEVEETREICFIEDSRNYDPEYAKSNDCLSVLYDIELEIYERYEAGTELTDENSFSNKLILGMEELNLKQRYTIVCELRHDEEWGYLYVSECEELESFLKANYEG